MLIVMNLVLAVAIVFLSWLLRDTYKLLCQANDALREASDTMRKAAYWKHRARAARKAEALALRRLAENYRLKPCASYRAARLLEHWADAIEAGRI